MSEEKTVEEKTEELMQEYNVPNPEHSPKAVEYLVRMYEYYSQED